MAAPKAWKELGSPPTMTGTSFVDFLSYANGYWFVCAAETGGDHRLQYASDPNGPWTTVTLPANPTGYEAVYNDMSLVYFDGTDYAVLVEYQQSGGGAGLKYRVLHATSPSGTWSAHEFDSSDLYLARAWAYGDGTWVIAGRYDSGTNRPAFIATSATAAGTYTFHTSLADTGLDNSVTSCTITDIGWDGTYWVQVGYEQSPTNKSYIQTAATPTGAWTKRKTYNNTGTLLPKYLAHQSGYWSAALNSSADFIYAADPTSTWGTVVSATHTVDTIGGPIGYDGSAWVVPGYKTISAVDYPITAYLEVTGDPSGTWSQSTFPIGFPSGGGAVSIQAAEDTWLVSVGRYSSDGILFVPATARPATLRQRQSPKRSPSRVGWY